MKTTAKTKGDSLETAVHVIEAAILKLSPSYTDKTFRIQGKKIIKVAGVHHELDIWVSVDLGHTYESVFVFECKNWRKKVTKNDIIVFSEKIKAAQAQRGFFVAKTFTRDARAQAKTDPRIEFLYAREVELADVPDCLQYFHVLERVHENVNCMVKLRVEHETGETEPLDLGTAILALDGHSQHMAAYIEEWRKDVTGKTERRFRSERQPENTYTLPFADTREFKDGACFVNGEPVARMDLTGDVQVQVWRGEVESRFEVESRGRFFRVVVNTPTGQVILSSHELIPTKSPRTP